MSWLDQICKAEALWALKTAKDDFEANDVSVSEAKGTTEENCSRTVEIGYEAFRFSVEGQ